MADMSDDHGMERSLAGIFADTINDGREWMAAEIAFLREQVNNGFANLYISLISALVATAFGTAGALILALAAVDFATVHVGRVMAGMTVGGILLVIAVALLLRARALFRRATFIPDRIERHILPKMRPSND